MSTIRSGVCRFALAFFMFLVMTLTALAKDKVTILNTGSQPGHYLYWDGNPIMPIGDSVTQGWMECGTNFNQNGYIDALSSRGVNLAMIWSYIGTSSSNQTGDSRIGYNSPEIWPWQGSTDSNSMDLTQLNQAYFDRLKSFVSYAESKDVMVLITVHDGGPKWRFSGTHPFNTTEGNGPLTSNWQYVQLADYNNEMPTTYNPSWNYLQKNQYYQERFADKLITELEPYSNVIYEMFNEGEWYDQSDRREHEEHFLRFFNDRTDALLMSNADHISGFDEHNNSEIDIVSRHRPTWTGNHSAFVSGFNQTPVKSYFMSECIPEYNGDGSDVSIDEIRQGAWETVLAGAGWVAQNNTSFGWDPNTTMAAQSANRDAVYDNIGHVATFFNDLGVEFWNMAPNTSLSSTGICLADTGDEYVVYAANGGTFWVNLSAGIGKTFSIQWYNPRTGALTSSGYTSGSTLKYFTAPDSNDWVLRLTTGVQIPGDANGDGVVDEQDASLLSSNWLKSTGATWFEGDFNGDGAVNEKDASILAGNWGVSTSASASVPEPSLMVLLAGMLLMSGVRYGKL